MNFTRRCTWYSEREKSPIKNKKRPPLEKNGVFQPYNNKRDTLNNECISFLLFVFGYALMSMPYYNALTIAL